MNKYPCNNPFIQFYMIARNKLYIRFCPFHSDMVQIEDYESLGYEKLEDIFISNECVNEVRDKFLSGDFAGAGCPESCECMSAFREGRLSYNSDDYRGEDGNFHFRKANLSMGPDCNIRCRYCLDADNFEIDFGSCKPKFNDFIVPFVKNGGYLLYTGGETLLPKWRFLDKLKELGQMDGVEGGVEFFTNATLLDEEACKIILSAPVRCVGISMDTNRNCLIT